jgi:CDP-6-deoxy-D-xylo-4-hexulose-3-dehydrase
MVADETELSLANLFGVREALLVDPGASANLVAITSLTSPLMGKLRLKPWDEVITVAAGSRSLVAAIVQNKLVPKFVDLALPGFNVDVQKLQGALS